MSQSNKTINAIIKEPVFMKFSVIPQKKIATASVSKGLREIFQESNVSYLEYGVDAEQNTIFIRLNDEGKGSPILDKQGKPRNTVAASKFLKYLIEEDVNLDLSKPFFLQQISQNIITLNNNVAQNKNEDKRDYSIKWIDVENNKGKVKTKAFKNKLWIRFHNSGIRQGFFRISKEFLDVLKEQKMTHLEVGFNRETKALFIRLNNLGNGIGLLNSLKEYKETHITASNELTYLDLAGINVEYLNNYFLHSLDNFVYRLSTSESEANLNSREIVWISSKKNSNSSLAEAEEERLNAIKKKAEERKERKIMIEKRKSLKFEGEDPKFEKRIAEKLRNEKLIKEIREAKQREKELEAKKRREKKLMAKKSTIAKKAPAKLTFRFVDKKDKKDTIISISKGFQRACKELQATHIQFGIANNGVYLKATTSSEGISVVNSSGEYKGLTAGATHSIREINSDIERLKTSKTYTLRKVSDLIFKVEDPYIPASSNVFSSENVIWISNKLPLTLKKQTNYFNNELITFSNNFKKVIKDSEKSFIDVCYNIDKQLVAIKLNDEGKGVRLREKANKKHLPVIRLLEALKDVGVTMEFDVDYIFKETSPNFFNITSNREVVVFQRIDHLFWLSETLPRTTKAKEHQIKELKFEELKITKEMLKDVQDKSDSSNKKIIEELSAYEQKRKTEGVNQVQKDKLTFKFKPHKTTPYFSFSKAFYRTCINNQATHLQFILVNDCILIELNKKERGLSLIDSSGNYKIHHTIGIGAANSFRRINSKIEHLKLDKRYALEQISESLFMVKNTEVVPTQNTTESNNVIRISNDSPLTFKKTIHGILFISVSFKNAIRDSKETFIDVGYNSKKEIVALSLNSNSLGVELTSKKDGLDIPNGSMLIAIESIGIDLDNLELEFQQLLPNYFSLVSGLEVDNTDPTELSWLSETLNSI
ncbi:cell envelope integrity protein TolA [Priestia megaterium]|uniref:Uncharacterized protein n=1 Tax=Priestia megaterium TaxID=1404 RepID=A0A6M6E003_PRIMG|nr:cell envelope integrity protein TolA [Priestia megaterium]QJX80332.1 hypothetical protein FDZ14_30035 [Priestia megaterium]